MTSQKVKGKRQQEWMLLLFTFYCLLFSPHDPLTAQTTINRPTLNIGSQGAAVTELQAVLKLLGFYSGAVDGVYTDSTAIAVSQFQQAAGLNPDGVAGVGTWQRLFPASPGTVAATPAATTTAARFPTPTVASRPALITTPVSNPQPRPAATRPSNPVRPRPAATQTSTGSSVDLPILRLGMRGPAVTTLQQRLKAIGLFKGAVDGDFGAETEAAVKAAQQRFRLAADGVVGPATWNALLR